MKKLLFLLFIPLFFLLSCQNNLDEITTECGNVSINKESLKEISRLVNQDSSLTSEAISINLTVLDSNRDKIKSVKNIETTFDKIADNKKNDINVSNVPFGMGYKIRLSVLFNGLEIFEGESRTAFNLTPEVSNVQTNIDINPITFKIKYIVDGVETENPHTNEYTFNTLITLETLFDSAKNFVGWYDNKEFKGNPIKELGGLKTIGDVTLYPKWENIQYTIKYVTGVDGHNIEEKVQPNYILTLSDLLPISKPNCTFKGWYLNDEFLITEGYKVTADVTLYARFNEAGTTHEVTFSPNPSNGTSLNKGDKIKLHSLTEPAKIYYTLDGSNPKESGILYNGQPIVLDKDSLTIKAYAKCPPLIESSLTTVTYTMNKYNVVFQNIDGTNYRELLPKAYGDTLTQQDLEPLPDTKNYTFISWVIDGREIREGEKVTSNMTITPLVRHIGKVSDVTYDGILEEGKTLTLKTNTTGAKIYYTVDGTSPSDPFGTRQVYNNIPINLGSNVLTIQAIAVKQGLEDSNITYINYTPNAYTVTFDSMGKGDTPAPITGKKKSDVITLPDLALPGYVFNGWQENGSSITSPYTINGNVKLSAQWSVIYYDIVKDGVKDGTYTIEDTVTLKSITKDGYDFDGWYTKTDNKEISIIKKGSQGTVDIVSRFNPITYTISYKNVDNVTETLPSSYTIESSVINLPLITKTGFTFDGWYTDELCSPSNKITSINTGSTGNLILYPKWTAINTVQSVSFDQKQGLLDNNSEIRLSSESGSTIYYTTDEKASKQDFVQYSDSTPILFTTDKLVIRAYASKTGLIDSEISTVVYNMKYYTVTFHNGGKGSCPLPISNLRKGDKLPAESIKPLVADGFEFSNWIDSDKNNVDSSYTVTNNTVITAVWTPWGEVSDVVISPSSGEIDYNTPITLTCSTLLSKIYYTTDGSDPTNSSTRKEYLSSSNIVLKEDILQINACSEKQGLYSSNITSNHYTMKKYDVYFNSKGKGSPVNPVKGLKKGDTIPQESLVPLIQSGYNFIHWEDSKKKGTAITSNSPVTSTMTLEAKWEPIVYNLNLDNEGVVNTSQYTIEDNILLTDPASIKTGYRFMGWYDSKNVDAVKVERINKGETGDKTLYAKFLPIEYTINYYNSDEPTYTYTIKTTESKLILPTPQNKDDMRFDGWFETSDFSGNPLTEITLTPLKNYNLYARWTALTQTSPVTFTDANNLNDKIELSCTTPASTIYYTTDGKDPTTSTTRIEYTTAGITLNKNTLVIKAYATCPGYVDSVVTSREYKVATYKCSFITPYGIVPSQNVAVGSLITAPVGLSNKYYILQGWVIEDSETGYITPWDFDTNTMPNKDIELTAMWMPIKYNINFNANGVDGLTDDTQSYSYDTTFTMPHFNVDLIGHTLKWSTQADGTGTVYELNTPYKNLCTKADETIILYAQYKPITYNVKIITNPDTPEEATVQSYEYGQYITLPTDLKLPGYRFNDEFGEVVTTDTGEEKIINRYKAGYKVRNLTSESGKTVVLKALFRKVVLTPISNVNVLQEDKKVTLSWTEPTDADFKETVINYDTVEKVLAKGTTTLILDQLVNNKCYTFTLTSRYNDGSTGNAVPVKSFANPLQTFATTSKALPSGSTGTGGTSGSYVDFGYWPQTIKADNVDITNNNPIYVNGLLKAYLGNDNNYYVKYITSPSLQAQNTFSTGSVIKPSTVYYFKVEPIRWRIITKNDYMQTGEKYLAEMALDYQIFDSRTDSSIRYEHSYIKHYLDDTFYKNAFSDEQRNHLNKFNSYAENLKVSLIDGSDIYLENPSDFPSSETKKRTATDYALSKGSALYSTWMTNTVSTDLSVVDENGSYIEIPRDGTSCYGVVPIINYVDNPIKG